ncbi:hypothetical protein CASFOL_028548 [Castilleja foliolosa]|uniref:Transmembrane protein n=1 Tax=Castilleja foliolosa TaxID=1961234 RepID=A0ABD3CBF7_9LAMI
MIIRMNLPHPTDSATTLSISTLRNTRRESYVIDASITSTTREVEGSQVCDGGFRPLPVTSLTSRRLKPRRRRKTQKPSSTMPRRPRTPNLLRRLVTRLLRLPTTMLGWMKPLRRRKSMMQGGKPRLPLSFSRRSQVTIVTILLILSLTLVTSLIYNFDD